MKRCTTFFVPFFILLFWARGASVQAQTAPVTDDHTAREEAEGKVIWEKLQAKQITCDTLSDVDFGALGEYFMGQMVGSSHEAMNKMMVQMMGEKGEGQMHVVMGKRLSSCDTSAIVPSAGTGFMPMTGMMGSGWGNTMGGWTGFGVLGWLPMVVFWIFLILGIIALVRYLGRSGQQQEGKSPLEILKERYAKGEINKKEFEQMKKDLT